MKPSGDQSLLRLALLGTLLMGIVALGVTVGHANTEQSALAKTGTPPLCDPGGPYSGAPGSLIEFDASRSHDSDGKIIGYQWDFGDGTSAMGTTASHAFSVEGFYEVTLTTIDDQSESTSCSFEVDIALRSSSDMTLPEDLLESHQIAFQGTVVGSITNERSYTDLEISVQEYLAGTGPTVARVRVKAVDTDRVKTIVSDSGKSGSAWTLPKIGDSAVFWIFHHQETAIIRGQKGIWLIKGDSIPALGLPLAQARLRVKAAVESLGWRRQLLSASQVVIARPVDTVSKPCEEEDAYYCHVVLIDRQLTGSPITDSSLRFLPSRGTKTLRGISGGPRWAYSCFE